MDGGTASDTGAVSADSTEVFERDVSERRRLELQFALLREYFDLWFDQTLRLGGLSTDPGRADWSVLDVGCGEGLFTREIVRRYPHARAVGIDVDADAIATASARSAAEANLRFLVHDVRQPPPASVAAGSLGAGAGFDVVVMWLVLPYLADRRTALANLAAVRRPGGVVLL